MVNYDREKLSQICHKHGIKRLAVFGSAVRADFTENSDIDLLVEFQPGRTPGFALMAIERELSTIFNGKKIDLITPKFLNPRIRERVLREAQVQYAA